METRSAEDIEESTEKLLQDLRAVVHDGGELLQVEWQQEKARLTELLVLSVALLFLGIMAMMLLTATIIFLFPEDVRKYIALGFTVLYLGGAVWAVMTIRSLVKKEPFSET